MINGRYVISSNGKILSENSNIVTSSGTYAINKFLSGDTTNFSAWASTIRYGASYTATSASDTSLSYETGTATISSRGYESGSIKFSATVNAFSGEIYEIGIIPSKTFAVTSLLTNFSEKYSSISASSNWYATVGSNKIYASSSAGGRVGSNNVLAKTASAYRIDSINAGTSLWTSTAQYLDLLYFVPRDSTSATSPSLTFVFRDSGSVAWKTSTVAVNVSASGYQKISLPISLKPSGIGNPTSLTASFVGGTASVSLDSLYYRSGKLSGPQDALLSRTSQSTPIISVSGNPQKIQIDYYLQVI